MADRLHVATHKGLFELARGHGIWEVANVHFLGDPVSAVLADADGAVYAGLDLGHFGAKLWRRDPAGAWQELAPPAFPPKAARCRRRSPSLVTRQDLGDRAGRCHRAPLGRYDARRALPLRRWWGILVAERGVVAYARAPAMVGGRRRRAARHRLRADRPAQSRRHPHRRFDRGRVGEHRWRCLVAQYQPRHVRRVHAA